jgi:hypothetical protein
MFTPLQLRKIHRVLAPIMVLPLLLTLVTGTLYQIAILMDSAPDYFYFLEWHRGTFGPVDLRLAYPYLNAIGLLVMVGTGISLWIQIASRTTKRKEAS